MHISTALFLIDNYVWEIILSTTANNRLAQPEWEKFSHMLGSFRFTDNTPATAVPTTSPTTLALAAVPYVSDFLGIRLSVRMPEAWEPSGIEDFGVKKIVFEGKEHTRVEFYLEAGEGLTPEIVANSRKEAIELKRSAVTGLQFTKAVVVEPTGDDKYVVSALVPGHESAEIDQFIGYYIIAGDDHVLCAELTSLGNATGSIDRNAFSDAVQTLDIEPRSLKKVSGRRPRRLRSL